MYFATKSFYTHAHTCTKRHCIRNVFVHASILTVLVGDTTTYCSPQGHILLLGRQIHADGYRYIQTVLCQYHILDVSI